MEAAIKQYKSYHKNPTNRAIHYVCIPLIFATGMGILDHTLGIPSTYVAALYAGAYFVFAPSALFGVLLVCYTAALWVLGTHLPLLVSHRHGIHITCWALQFVGHSALFENRRPALVDNLVDSLLWAPSIVFFDLTQKYCDI